MTDPKPKQAILIQRQWVDKIFDPDPERRKTWEIRSFNAEKRGLLAVGVTGESKLEGEVELVIAFGYPWKLGRGSELQSSDWRGGSLDGYRIGCNDRMSHRNHGDIPPDGRTQACESGFFFKGAYSCKRPCKEMHAAQMADVLGQWNSNWHFMAIDGKQLRIPCQGGVSEFSQCTHV